MIVNEVDFHALTEVLILLSNLFPVFFPDREACHLGTCSHEVIMTFVKCNIESTNHSSWSKLNPILDNLVNFIPNIIPSLLNEIKLKSLLQLFTNDLLRMKISGFQSSYHSHHEALILLIIPVIEWIFLEL
jgi:hypothetical protein